MDALVIRIQFLSYKLGHYHFMTDAYRARLEIELNLLILDLEMELNTIEKTNSCDVNSAPTELRKVPI